MADSATFRQLLSKTTETAERPRALAIGHYIGEIKTYSFGESSQKKTPFVRFIMVPTEETEDVPEGANEGIDFSKKELRKDLYITPEALYRLTDFLNSVLGEQNGRTFDERIPETRSVRVLIQVGQRENERNPEEKFNEVGTVVAYNG